MRTCTFCGEILDQDAEFCTNCGNQQPIQQMQTNDNLGNVQLFCPNCGLPLEADSSFCTNCGYQIPKVSRSAPVKAVVIKKAKQLPWKKIAVAGGVAAAVVVLAVLIVNIVVFGSPAKRFVRLQELYVAERVKDAPFKLKAVDKISTDIILSGSVQGSSMAVSQINDSLQTSSLTMKVDASKNKLILNSVLNLMGSDVMHADLTVDGQEVGFCLQEVDDKYYLADIARLSETFGVEMSNKDMDFSGLIPTEKELSKLASRYEKVARTAVTRSSLNVYKREWVELEYLNKDFKGTLYSYRPGKAEIEDMLFKLADTVESDEELQDLADRYYDYLNGLDQAGLLDYSTRELKQSLAQGTRSMSKQIADRAEEIAEALKESGFTWEMACEGKTVRLISIKIDNTKLVYENTGDSDKDYEEVFYLKDNYGIDYALKNSYRKTGKRYDGDLTLSAGGETVTLSYDIDESKHSILGIPYGEYDLNISGEAMGISLDIREAGKATDHIIKVYGLSSETYGVLDSAEIVAHLTDKGSARKPSSREVDITWYSKSELESLGEDLLNGMYRVLEDSSELKQIMDYYF